MPTTTPRLEARTSRMASGGTEKSDGGMCDSPPSTLALRHPRPPPEPGPIPHPLPRGLLDSTKQPAAGRPQSVRRSKRCSPCSPMSASNSLLSVGFSAARASQNMRRAGLSRRAGRRQSSGLTATSRSKEGCEGASRDQNEGPTIKSTSFTKPETSPSHSGIVTPGFPPSMYRTSLTKPLVLL
ncbi:unnamed protein product [Diplocarpon coronariae]|nr:hypothetical protein JHW43_001935 [Diplocarpon mali]